MPSPHNTQTGFSMPEIFACLMVFGILAATSLQSATQLKSSFSRASLDETVKEMVSSLESNQIKNNLNATGHYSATWNKGIKKGSKELKAWSPKVNTKSNLFLHVSYDGREDQNNCATCTRYFVYGRDCANTIAKTYVVQQNGVVNEFYSDDNWSCET